MRLVEVLFFICSGKFVADGDFIGLVGGRMFSSAPESYDAVHPCSDGLC